jgi:hypothetical protein
MADNSTRTRNHDVRQRPTTLPSHQRSVLSKCQPAQQENEHHHYVLHSNLLADAAAKAAFVLSIASFSIAAGAGGSR